MDYFSGWCKSKARLDGKTAIVTGANSGIGKETVLDFYKRGARVIMACRNQQFAEETKKEIEAEEATHSGLGSLVIRPLDLASLESVRTFYKHIVDNELCVHILVNNAAVMACPRAKTEDGFEMQMGTNYLGHALLTLLLLPKLIKSAPSRIVCVSSKVHENFPVNLEDINFEKTTYSPLEAYCRSKSAIILFARELARRLKEYNVDDVRTYSVHPGIVHTELGRHFSDSLWPGATWIWHNVFSWFLKTPRCGAQTTIYCSVAEDTELQSGLYYSDCAVIKSSKETQNDATATSLWDVTIQLLKIQYYDPFSHYEGKIKANK